MTTLQHTVSHDSLGTHIDWRHEGISAHMIDWFWSNMEKGFILWHPEQHEPLEWALAPKHGDPLGAIHIAPQTWNDGRRQNLYIRFERLADVPPTIRDYIVYEHVMIVAGLGLGAECLVDPLPWVTACISGRKRTMASSASPRPSARGKKRPSRTGRCGRRIARRRSAIGEIFCRSCTRSIGSSPIPTAIHLRTYPWRASVGRRATASWNLGFRGISYGMRSAAGEFLAGDNGGKRDSD
jgi:hypothetical protein